MAPRNLDRWNTTMAPARDSRVIAGEPWWKGDFSFWESSAGSRGLSGADWGAPHIMHNFLDSVPVQGCTVARQGDLFAGKWLPDEA